MRLCEKKRMDDMVLTLFDGDTTRLRHVRLSDASKLTVKGLKTLKGHKIVELEALGLTKATVGEMVNCLGEWSLHNLRHLNVANSTFLDSNKFCVIVELLKLKNLQVLNVSNTEFNNASLKQVVEDLAFIDHLDLSGSKVTDITALRKCKTRLRSLSLYGCKLPAATTDTVVGVLADLAELRNLDISDDKEEHAPFDMLSPGARFRVASLLQKTAVLPKLQHFDISGKEVRSSIDGEGFKCDLAGHSGAPAFGFPS